MNDDMYDETYDETSGEATDEATDGDVTRPCPKRNDNLLVTPKRVIEIAYAGEAYTPETAITDADILAAQQRYITPVVGEDMVLALLGGSYATLYDEYVVPALAEYVRLGCNTPSAPAVERVRLRARALLRLLSSHLNDNQSEYPEYVARKNVLNRCNCDGGFVQVL